MGITRIGNQIHIGTRILKLSYRIGHSDAGIWVKYNLAQKEQFIIMAIEAMESTGLKPESATISSGGEVLSVWYEDRRARQYEIKVRLKTEGVVDWAAWLRGRSSEVLELEINEEEL